jgi:poly(hydroxyalkanoate) depolymerase family esterase
MTLAALGAVATGCTGSASQTTAPAGSFEAYSYSNDAGTRTYKVYTPAAYSGAPLALLVDLHGCSSSADEEARWSHFNELAERFSLIVAYPEQSSDANGSRCWNWFLPDHQVRDAGEPSLIAGITREVMGRWNVDQRRVYVTGISAGGAMSNIMAVTYPDLYAAVMIYAGCQYKGFCFGTITPFPAEVGGETAYEAMGALARAIPVLVIQGDMDPLVLYPNADIIVQQFLASADWADNGANDGSVSRERAATRADTKPGGHMYEIDDYTDATGCLLAQRWLIHGMGHAWSNAESNGSPRDTALTDPQGPDVSTPTFEFLLSHVMPASGTACTQE